jgi:hypothetical protein
VKALLLELPCYCCTISLLKAAVFDVDPLNCFLHLTLLMVSHPVRVKVVLHNRTLAAVLQFLTVHVAVCCC